jgi:multisubunit Na+/H+ antiporter MnhC subunit
VVRLVLTGIVTLVAFTVMMPVLFLFMRPARDELDVDTAKLRAEKQRQKKRR